MENLQEKSHELLLKVLNNIGIIGAIFSAIADIIFVMLFIFGIEIKQDFTATIIFAVVNALIGILIGSLLRYQGQKYAEIENKELLDRYYNKKIKSEKKHISMGMWQLINILKDIFIKGVSTTFSIAGLVYISIKGSNNPIQLLITLCTLVMFACFGLIGMNSAYYRFYNIQIPYMNKELEEKKEDGTN